MLVLEILSLLVAAFFLIIIILYVLLVVMYICVHLIYPICMILRGKVYCRHCLKKIYFSHIHDHDCFSILGRPKCKALNTIRCSNEKCSSEHLTNCLSDHEPINWPNSHLERDILAARFPGLENRM